MSSNSWYDIMVAEEQNQTTRWMRMTPAEWTVEARRLIRAWRGDIRHCIAFLRTIDAKRATTVVPGASVAPQRKTEFDVDFGLWRDMVEEPEKFGDEIDNWLELNDKLTTGSGRWRLGAFWSAREEQIRSQNVGIRRENAATRIQAAVRGHQMRTNLPVRDCCMCLAHRISPLRTDVGMMCRDCYAQGPYDDITGPLADPWAEFRADVLDHAPCQWCFAPLDVGQQNYCDDDCKLSLIRETHRGIRC